MQIRCFRESDTEAVVDLWRECGLLRSWNDPYRDIERKIAVGREFFLVGVDSRAPIGASNTSALIAVAMGGYEGHRGWVNYLAVSPKRRGEGHGAAMMAALEQRLLACGCPKLNLQIRSGNAGVQAFYERLGYTLDATVSYGKRLIPD